MFSEASPSNRIETAFPQGIQKPALARSWEIGDVAVKEQQSEATSWGCCPWGAAVRY